MIVELIKKRMDKLGITQEEMAERIHVTPVTVSRWVTGKRYPTSKHLENMANEVGCILELKERTKNE